MFVVSKGVAAAYDRGGRVRKCRLADFRASVTMSMPDDARPLAGTGEQPSVAGRAGGLPEVTT
jgi:hypothetical protein